MVNFELLAPGGDIDSIKAAIIAGADAVYCGLIKFNARNRAVNIALDDLNGIIQLAHNNNCKIYLTLNIIIIENEISELFKLLNKLTNIDLDGIIVQDIGLFYILKKYFAKFIIHASTQFNTHNEGQINFLKKLKISRINLSRELNIKEIKHLTKIAHKMDITTEVFVHGSYCISFSGICYMSSVQSGKSGNRGRCSQPCRDRYLTTPMNKNYPLNLKDNSAYFNLQGLFNAGVDSLKIEGRVKKFHYVYTIVNHWKKHLNNLKNNKISNDNSELYKVFNRDFSDSYLKGDINKNMFIDNPRDNSIKYLSKTNSNIMDIYRKKDAHIKDIKVKIDQLNIEKIPLILNRSKSTPHIEIPILTKKPLLKINPILSILIDSIKDLNIYNKTNADIFYQIPNYPDKENLMDIFLKNKNIFPWFPSILIGDNYKTAVELLLRIQPKIIITNNTGIAYEAYKNKIPWIAGPYLNIINSFGLLNIKENFNCKGAFISNEINKEQIKRINRPENFKLYYSIYHPILLMTSRQCLHHQVIGCDKIHIDKECILECEKTSSITNLKNNTFLIQKKKENYHRIYNNINFLNTEIVTDIQDKFSSFFIDLRDIKTETKIDYNKLKIINLFENLLNKDLDSANKIKQIINPIINNQYIKGI